MARLFIEHTVDDSSSKGHNAELSIESTIYYGSKEESIKAVKVRVAWPKDGRNPIVSIDAREIGIYVRAEEI